MKYDGRVGRVYKSGRLSVHVVAQIVSHVVDFERAMEIAVMAEMIHIPMNGCDDEDFIMTRTIRVITPHNNGAQIMVIKHNKGYLTLL